MKIKAELHSYPFFLIHKMWQIWSYQIDTSLSCEWTQRLEQPDPNVARSSAKEKSKDEREDKDGSRQSLLLISLHLAQDCSLIELASLNLAPASDLRSWLCLSGNLHTIFVTLSKEDILTSKSTKTQTWWQGKESVDAEKGRVWRQQDFRHTPIFWSQVANQEERNKTNPAFCATWTAKTVQTSTWWWPRKGRVWWESEGTKLPGLDQLSQGSCREGILQQGGSTAGKAY